MLYSKGKLVSVYLKRAAGIMSAVSPEESLQKRRDALKEKEKSFEISKKESLQSIKYSVEQFSVLLNRMKGSGLEPAKDREGNYYFKNDYTDELQKHIDEMKKTFEGITEKYQDLKHEEDAIEQEEKDIEYEKEHGK